MPNADVAELADALDSGSSEVKLIWVQVPSSAPKIPNAFAFGIFLYLHVAKSNCPQGMAKLLLSSTITYPRCFESAGVAEEPITWQERVDVCEKVKAAGVTPSLMLRTAARCLYNPSSGHSVWMLAQVYCAKNL